MRRTILVCAGGVVVCAMTAAAYAQRATYENTSLHYSVALPAGWEEIPRDVLDEVAVFIQKETGIPQQRFEAGFQQEAEQWLAYPYVLIQHHRGAGSFEELAKAFKALPHDKVRDRLKGQDVLLKPEFGGATIDRERELILLPLSMEIAGIGPVRGVSAFKRGRTGVVQLSFYARAEEFSRYHAQMAVFLSSLAFEPGYE